MLQLVLGPAGSGKTQWARETLAQKAKAGKSGLVLLVPEQFSFESERGMLRLLGAEQASLVKVETFTRLAQRVFSQTGGRAGRPIDDAGRSVLMGLALEQSAHSLEIYRRQANKPDFAEQMLRLTSECKQAGIGGEDLESAAKRLPEGLLHHKTQEIGRIMQTYEALVQRDHVDSADDLTVLEQKLKQNLCMAGQTFVLDSFKGFTKQQLSVIRQLLKQAENVSVCLCCDGLDGPMLDRFAAVRQTARQLMTMAKEEGIPVAAPICLETIHRFTAPDLRHLERYLLTGERVAWSEHAEHVHICSYADFYQEAEGVAREIHRLVREEGLRYRDIAVIARDVEVYRGILDPALELYDIPYFMDCRRPAESLPIFRMVASALDIAENGYDKQNVFTMLKTGLCGFTPLEISQLENYVLIWNYTGRRFEQEWTANPDGFQDEFTPEQIEQLQGLNDLRQRVVNPIKRFQKRLSDGTTGQDHGIAVFSLLEEFGAMEALAALCRELESTGDVQLAQDQRQSYDLLCQTLDQTVLALQGLPVSADQYIPLWRMCAARQDMGRLPQGLDQVMVGSAERMRPNAPSVVFLVGVNEGVFPRESRVAGLFSHVERERLIDLGLEISDAGEQQFAEERFLFYSSICAASDEVYLFYRTGSEAGELMLASEFIQEVEALLPNCQKGERAQTPLEQVEALRPALSLAARHYKEYSAFSESLRAYLKTIPTVKGQLCAIERAAEGREDTLSPQVARPLFGERMRLSPSRIDAFYRCRFSYFCEYGIAAKAFRTAEMNVMERGTLIHLVLERGVNQFGGGELATVSQEELTSFVREELEAYVDRVMGGWDNQPPFMKYWMQQTARLLVLLLRQVGNGFQNSLFRPWKTELRFGGKDGVCPPEIPLPDGGSVSVNGIIDRVDLYRQDNKTYVRVVDYKTGRLHFNLNDVQRGQGLQMLAYLFTVQRAGKKLLGEEVLPAGVLYFPAREVQANFYPSDHPAFVEKKLNCLLKMNGLLLDDPAILHAQEIGGEGVYTPYKLKADGTPDGRYSSIANAAALGVMERHIDRLLVKMGMALHRGDIRRNPLDSTNHDACAYCDYSAVCGRDPWEENEKISSKASMTQVIEEMEEEEKNGLFTDGGTATCD